MAILARLPESDPNDDMPEQYDRTRLTVIRAIAQCLLSQDCLEQGVARRRLADLDATELQRFVEAAAFITAWVLDADRRDTAIMCMADVLCADGSDRGIDDYPRSVQQRYYRQANTALNALVENMKDNPPDRFHRERMCRLVDGLFPKQQPATKGIWG